MLSHYPLMAQESDNDQVERIPVTGTRLQKTEAEEATKIEISGEQAGLVAPGGDIAQVPKLFPGTLARPLESEVSIRGSENGDTLYYIDDLQAPNLFEPISGTSVVPNKAIDNLKYSAGNFDSEYGNASGGVIKLSTRDEDILDPYTELRLNVPIYTSAYHEQALGDDSTMILSMRKSLLEAFVPLVMQEEGQVIVPYFQDAYLQHFYGGDDLSVKTRYVHNRSGAEVKVFTDRSLSTDGTSSINFATGYDLFGSDIVYSLSSTNLELSPYISNSFTEFTIGTIFFNIKVNTFTLPVRTQLELSENFNLFLGLEAVWRDFKLDALVPNTTSQGTFADPENAPKVALDVDGTQQEYAGWASLEMAFGDLTLTPGIRGYRQSNLDADIDPRLLVRYRLSDFNTTKFAVGRYSSAPGPEQLDESFGNPSLSWIRSLHYTAGLESSFFNYWTSDIQIYYKEWANDILDDDVEKFLPDTTRESKGLEWFLRYDNDARLFGWLSYTYSDTKEKRGKDAIEVSSDNDVTHILHLVANYKLSDTFQFGSRLKHQTGYVFTPIEQVWYQTNTDTYQPIENPSLVNSSRVPDTTTLSLFAQQEWKYESWELVTRYGFEDYQFTESSPDIEYNYDYSKKQFTTGLPVIPFIELRAIL